MKTGSMVAKLRSMQPALRKALSDLVAVEHRLRQKMVNLIIENGSMTVSDIRFRLRLEQSVASQHLRLLKNAGVVSGERDGKFIHYSVDLVRLKEILGFAKELAR